MYVLQTLAGFSDVDNFCDVVDALEEQGIEKHMDVSPAIASSWCVAKLFIFIALSHMSSTTSARDRTMTS